MSKFCSHCGKEVNENAVVCVNCGCAIDGTLITKTKIPGKGLGIASMVIGIIAVFYGMFSMLISTVIISLDEFYYFEEKIAFAIICNFLPIVLSIIGLSLGCSSIFKTKTGMNITGIILNAITLLISIICITLIIAI